MGWASLMLDVLQRCYLGLTTEGSVLNVAEAEWVVRRLAELSQWAQPLQLTTP